MGRFLNDFRSKGKNVYNMSRKFGNDTTKMINNYTNKQINKKQKWNDGRLHSEESAFLGEDVSDFDDEFRLNDDLNYSPYSDNIQPAQKPASFHHYILEPKYQDLEKSIKGYKDVYNKDKREWEVKRMALHCFTDEEAEEILRTAQSHLATDIKLTFYSKETFGIRFLAIYEKIEFLFKRIMEYRYGRYGDPKTQGEMKEEALKIFIELITRIEANYLRDIQGMENKYN